MQIRIIKLHTIICIILSISCISFNMPEIEQESEKTMQQYKECLLTGNKKLIRDMVSESFRAGVYQQPISLQMFSSFLDVIQMPDSIFWGNLQLNEDEIFRIVHYIFGEDEIISNVTFSENGKMLFSDWIDQKGFGIYRQRESKYICTVPFELKDNKIIIRARLNDSDRTLRMLFDTGADGMALVKKWREECKVEITRSQTTNVPGGQMQVNMSENNKLILDSLAIPNQSLILLENIGNDIDGIIGGANLFRKYITEINFDTKEIKLYTLGKFAPGKEYKSSDLTYFNGVPTVDFNIYKDGHHFESNFIFDTGAGYNAILFGSGMKKLLNDNIDKIITPNFFSYNRSLGNTSKISIGQTDSIKFNHMCFKNVYLAMEAYNPQNHGRHNVMGSIGIKSLSKFNWIVNLVDYKIHTTPNRFTKLPSDFELNGYLFGYNEDRLMVIRPVSAEKNENLTPGDYILSIGNVKSEELTDSRLENILQKNKIKLIINKAEGSEKIILQML